jgi:DNA mismatch repair ATPase MutS
VGQTLSSVKLATEPLLEAEAIGHPLIEEGRVVRNDVQMGGADGPRVLVVSGSNMSGKSTLLRTLGVNVVLAQAGAPVRARRLRISPLAVGASIRVTDSLQGGVSRFYAEILRLRQILDATARPGPNGAPVLFLIDEFLHGTNSHDRRIGAEAVVRGLVERGAIGLITTHDLALADIAGALGARAANVHFEDHIEDGRMVFDYAMRPGVVRKSNAIELMRSVGLEI